MGSLTQEVFIAKAVAVHGVGRYDYSQVVYVKSRANITIICPEHGAFMQFANKHLCKQGCPKCGLKSRSSKRRDTAASFIQKARAIHGDAYDYATAIYTPASKGLRPTIKIKCPLHGYFEQNSSNHLAGYGCAGCGYDKAGSSRVKQSKEDFEQKARAIHGLKYNYSQLDYRKARLPALIICPEHGPFLQAPNSHLNGAGCPTCGIQLIIESKTYSKEQFIEKAISVHGQKYDYTSSGYRDSERKIAIRCPAHGLFIQGLSSHLAGVGCPGCGLELMRLHWVSQAQGKPATLYLLQVNGPNQELFYKVGITYRSVAQRYHGKSIHPYSYTIIALYKSVNAQAVFDWEQSILDTFAHLAYIPKSPFQGYTECFSEVDPILNALPFGTSFY